MFDEDQIRLKRIRRLVTIGIVALVFVWFFLLAATHGRIVVDKNAGWDKVTLQSANKTTVKTVSKGATLFSSGSYLASLNRNNRTYSYWIHVPRWFGAVSLNPNIPKEALAIKRANNTRSLHIDTGGILYSIGTGVEKSVIVHSSLTDFPFVQNSTKKLPSNFRPVAAYGDSFIGYTDNTEGGGLLVRYQPASNSLVNLSAPESANVSSNKLIVMPNGAGLIYYNGNKLYLLKTLSSSAKEMNISSSDIKTINNSIVATASNTKLYVYQGQDKKGVHINVYDIATGQKTETISISDADTVVNDLSVSPNGTYLVLESAKGAFQLYNDSTKTVSPQFKPENKTGQGLWLADGRFVYLDSVSGVQQLNPTENTVAPLFSSTSLAFTNLEQNGTRLFVTASAAPDKDSKDQLQNTLDINPVVYTLDTTQSSTSTTTNDFLPHKTPEYILDTLNGKVFFVPITNNIRDPLLANPSQAAKSINDRINDAKHYMEEHKIPNSNVIYLQNLRFNIDLFWAKGS